MKIEPEPKRMSISTTYSRQSGVHKNKKTKKIEYDLQGFSLKFTNIIIAIQSNHNSVLND